MLAHSEGIKMKICGLILIMIGLLMGLFLDGCLIAKGAEHPSIRHWVSASGEQRHPIRNAILKLMPKMSPESAMEYSNLFYKYSAVYKIDPFLMVSVAFKESTFKADEMAEACGLDYPNHKEVCVPTDFCLMQIHYSNVLKYNLDAAMLLSDMDHCVEWGYKIMNGFVRNRKKDPHWYSRYNAKTGYKRRIYQRAIMTHYRKIITK